MSFDLAEDWVWDFWLADDGRRHHLFFLTAPRSLGDPDLRHRHARVGHAVSSDLRTWERLPDALLPAAPPAYDDLAVWTGSVVRADDGTWRMFSTGLSRADGGRVQRIGVSTSADLLTWTRRPGPGWPLGPDGGWYADETTTPAGAEVHWRDPFVVRDDAGLWHLYVTARAAGPVTGAGLVGHATSPDLEHWTVGPPLSPVGGVPFDQLEVMQVVRVDGRWLMVFSCLGPEMPGAPAGAGGVWCVPVEGPGAAVDLSAAYRLTDETWYVGKLVAGPDGWGLMAFRHRGPDGAFVGGVSDPMPVTWDGERLIVEVPLAQRIQHALPSESAQP